MSHFTPCAGDIGYFNQVVSAFDVTAYANDVAQSGATYVVFTIGQAGFFCSPNAALNGLCGNVTSSRDLISDVAGALAAKNIKLIVYIPSGAPQCMQAGTQFTSECSADQNCRRSAFQVNWQNAIAEYSRRWGGKVAGWWIDGCYDWQDMYAATSGPNFQTLAAAARAGNAASLVAFNDGLGPYSNHTQFGDIAAGEVHDPGQSLVECEGRWINDTDPTTGSLYQVQWSLHTFIGHNFAGGARYTNDTPRFSNSYIAAFVKRVVTSGGTCQLDVPIHMGGCNDPNGALEGHLSSNFMPQLQAIAAGLSTSVPSVGTNVGARQTATADNSYSGTTPTMANDGSVGTTWASGTDGSSVKWWQVDLGVSRAINAVQLVFSQSDNRDFLRQNFQIRASDDPNFASFDLIGNEGGTCYLPPFSDFFTFPTTPVTRRYVRFTRSTDDPYIAAQHFQIAEARVYASMPSNAGVLQQGAYLTTGQFLASPSGKCFLIMQSDGNLVLYSGSGPADNHGGLWCSLAVSQPQGNYFAILQSDGNLCVYKGTGPADNRGFVWCNFTSGQDFLQVGDNLKLSISRGAGPANNQGAIWTVP